MTFMTAWHIVLAAHIYPFLSLCPNYPSRFLSPLQYFCFCFLFLALFLLFCFSFFFWFQLRWNPLESSEATQRTTNRFYSVLFFVDFTCSAFAFMTLPHPLYVLSPLLPNHAQSVRSVNVLKSHKTSMCLPPKMY